MTKSFLASKGGKSGGVFAPHPANCSLERKRNSRMATPNTQFQIQFQIIGGPSRESLRDSVGSPKGFRIVVEFKVLIPLIAVDELRRKCDYPFETGGERTIYAVVNSYEWEDGSGESFNLKGLLKWEESGNVSRSWRAYFRTDKRTGVFSL
jgi:hypothetical protein